MIAGRNKTRLTHIPGPPENRGPAFFLKIVGHGGP